MKTARVILLTLVLLMMIGTASAASSYWSTDEDEFNSVFTWMNEPTNAFDVGETRVGYTLVDTTNGYHPDSTSVNNASMMTYAYQTIDFETLLANPGDSLNVSMEINAPLQSYNYEKISLIIENSGLNYYAMTISRSSGNRDIFTIHNSAGTRARLFSTTSVPQANLDSGVLKFQFYNEAGTIKFNSWYIPDSGIPVAHAVGVTSAWTDFSRVGFAVTNGGGVGSTANIKNFIINDETPSESPYNTPAGAITYSSLYNTIYVNSYSTDLPEIYYALRTQYSESEVNSSMLYQSSPGVWVLIPKLEFVGTSKLYLNSSTVTELRTRYASENYYTLEGNLDANDTKIIGWESDDTEREFSDGLPYFNFYNADMDNVTFEKNGQIFIGTLSTAATSPTIRDLTITNYRVGLRIRATGADIDGIYMSGGSLDYRTTTRGIYSSYMGSSTVKNITIDNPALYTGNRNDDATGAYGFQTGGYNSYFENIYVNGSVYSGFATGGEYNYYRNLTAIRTHHNAIEIHDKNSIVDGFYISENTIHGLFSSHAPGQSNPDGTNNTFLNGTILHDGTGDKAIRGYMTNDFTYRNIYVLSDGGGGYQGDNCSGSLFDNVTVDFVTSPSSGEAAMIFTYVESPTSGSFDNTIINSNLSGNIIMRSSRNNKIANTAYSAITDDLGGWDSSYVLYYPLNVRVFNTSRAAVYQAEIIIDSTLSPINVLGEEIQTNPLGAIIYTGTNGYPATEDILYVADQARAVAGTYTYYTLDVTATKDLETDTIDGINPDASWLSPDINSMQGTLYTLVLDVEGYGEPVESLFITESSPTDTTPTITAVQSQQFSATTNAAGTFVWTLDGATVRTTNSVTTDSYTASGLAAGEYTVLLTVTSGEDSVIQSWTLTVEEEPVTPPVEPQEPRDRMSGPETAIALIGVLLVVLVATAILGSLAGLITGVIDMQQTAAIIGVMVLVAVLAFVGLAVLSGISGALNL